MFEIRSRKRVSLESKNLSFCCQIWSPRVFEIRPRKRVSLGSEDLFFRCRKWSLRVFDIRARKRVSFGRRASRPGLLLRLRLPLRREFQFCEFVLGRSRLLRYALVKVNKDAIKYYTLVIQTPTKNTPQCYSSSSSS